MIVGVGAARMKAKFVIGLAAVTLSTAAALSEPIAITRYIDEDVDRVPTHTVAPEYPRIARRDRIEGEVRVCYHIDKKGRPYRVGVRDSTHRIFERPAMRAIKASSYRPLKSGEKTSGIKTCRTFVFELAPAVADNGN